MTTHRCTFHLPKSVTRRDLMCAGLAGAGFLALGPLGRRITEAFGAPIPNHKRMVVINLGGGNDTLNMFIPVGLAQYQIQRGSIAIAGSAALDLNGTSAYKVHPSMPRTRDLWNLGHAAIVQKVGYPKANLSHFESQDIVSYGVRNGFTALQLQPSGWIARYADLYAPTPLGAMSVGMGRPLEFVGGTSNPLLVSSLASFKISGTGSNAVRTYRLQKAKEILASAGGAGVTATARDALNQAHDMTGQILTALTGHNTYLSTSGVTWPSNAIANRMKDIAALIHGGFGTRIFYTGVGGYDTHGGQATAHATLLGQLDGALGAFYDEMTALGVWNDVVVVVITEFGRRNSVNGSDGTDHGHPFTGLVLGGNVNGGASKGPDLQDADLTHAQGYPVYGVDFRTLYKEVLAGHLGVDDLAPVFPEALVINNAVGLMK